MKKWEEMDSSLKIEGSWRTVSVTMRDFKSGELRRYTPEQLERAYLLSERQRNLFRAKKKSALKACNRCGQDGLVWTMTDRGWRLAETSGELHKCWG